MGSHWTDIYSFVTGAIRQADLGYLILSNDEAAEKKIPMAGIVQWEPEGWGDGGTLSWRVAGVCIVTNPIEQLCVVGEFGDVFLIGSGDSHEEQVIKTPKKNRAPIRGVRNIDGFVYCVGMNSQVYKRSATNKWKSINHNLSSINSEVIFGFEAIDGYSDTNIYVVGWDGVICYYDGKNWTLLNSPVNTILLDVLCAEDGWVYACGRNGVLIKGRNNDWSIVQLGEFSEDIWSLAYYRGELYLSSMKSVMVLRKGKLVNVVMSGHAVKTFFKLAVGHNLLWSIGPKDVMSFDGKDWTRID